MFAGSHGQHLCTSVPRAADGQGYVAYHQCLVVTHGAQLLKLRYFVGMAGERPVAVVGIS